MKSPPTIEDFGFIVEIPTRWADLDALGHVNNTRFFTFDETARLDYFGELMRNDDQFWKAHGLILARIECDFISQLRHPASVRAGFRIERLGRSSMNTLAAYFVDGKPVAISRGVVVWFDYNNQKPLAIPDSVRQMIRGRERIAPLES